MQPDLRTNDVQLTAADVGRLENADQVVHFFHRLHYNVDSARPLDHASLNMDTEWLRHWVHGIRQVATDPEEEEIRVYLMEVRSVTVRLVNKISSRFRERPVSALLVLTSDYETLDFALLDFIAEASESAVQPFKTIVQWKRFTVDRRNPGPVSLRALRRFTYTESDPLFQLEKLHSAFDLTGSGERYFNNRALFSDYYLKKRLTDPQITPAWNDDVLPVGREVFRLLSNTRQKYSNEPESTVRRGLYEPLFDRLGFHWQKNKAGASGADEPDYYLYPPDDVAEVSIPRPSAADDDGSAASKPRQPLAAVLTYVWNRNLDMTDEKRDPHTPDEIPGALVVSVLERGRGSEESPKAVPWVIVTNGKLWRLYAAEADNKATNYYEVDLEEALATEHQVAALKYWWLFFRREAFEGMLDDVLQASEDYAKALGERLKDRVFEEIFPHFAAGFMAYRRGQRGEGKRGMETAATQSGDQAAKSGGAGGGTEATFEATLTFLYRLMFLLYAESLELLPIYEERGYRPHSLYCLKKAVAEVAGTIEDEAPQKIEAHYSDTSTELYEQLRELFRAVNEGSEAWNLPVYNGGLFSPRTDGGQFLENQAIPDRHLALGLDRLARDVDEKTQALAMIDYKDLGVRHLGSIYEGLLEFRLRVASQKLAVVRQNGRDFYMPMAEAEENNRRIKDKVDKGDVYLENDRRERRATASYYTPDYIVKYIVEHTVGPVMERKFEELAPRLRKAQRRYRQHKKRVEARGGDQSPELWWKDDDARRLADDCLDLRVLDPAMGSGHFLVEAVDFVSNRLLDFLNAWSENPVWAMLERMRQEILADVEAQGVSIDAGKLTRVALLKRAVLKRCVYGVDLNEMAVELAKVSLWLDAFTLGAPLSFLNHHLKSGNSLIGTFEISDMVAPGSPRWQQITNAAGRILTISRLTDVTHAEVRESSSFYELAQDEVRDIKKQANVFAATHFVPELMEYQYSSKQVVLGRVAQQAYSPTDDEHLRHLFSAAQDAARDHSFFHWKLEFPEVFFAPSTPGGQDVDLRKEKGFDAVVGNPPYVAWAEIGEYRKRFETGEYLDYQYHCRPNHADAQPNLYLFFSALMTKLLRESGVGSYIVPQEWLDDSKAQDFARGFTRSSDAGAVVVFNPEFRVFTQADETIGTTSLLLFLAESAVMETKPNHIQSYYLPTQNLAEVKGILSQIGPWDNDAGSNVIKHAASYEDLQSASWKIWLLSDASEIKAIFDRREKSLVRTADNRWFRIGGGFQPPMSLVRYFTLTTSKLKSIPSEERQYVFPALVDASSMQRYHIETEDRYWIVLNTLSDLAEARHLAPYLLSCLQAHKNILRESLGDSWWKFPNVRNLDFFAERSHKLLTPRTASVNSFAVDTAGHVFKGTNSYVRISTPYNQFYLAAVINSSLLNQYYDRFGKGYHGSSRKYEPGKIDHFPVWKIAFETAENERERLGNRLRRSHGVGQSSELLRQIDRIAQERNDVIHDFLAYLAKQMMSLKSSMLRESSRFLNWLEEELKIMPEDEKTGLDTFDGKTFIQGYAEAAQDANGLLSWQEMEYRIYDNRRRFLVDWESVKGKVQTEYEKSLEKLRPIKQQLAETDALIDKIVYKLYGLTEEEIVLIEQPPYEEALREAKEAVVEDEKLQKDPDAAAGAMAEKVLPAAQRMLQRVEHREERERLDRDLPGWHLFPGDVPTFLLTGEYNIRRQPHHLDFSTSVVSYAKAVETVLFQRLFVPFREQHQNGARINNKFLRQFVEGSRDHLTLGSMKIILPSSKETALREFALQVFPVGRERLFGPQGVAALLNDREAINLRNRAAHDEVLTREEAQKTRQWAIAILGNL